MDMKLALDGMIVDFQLPELFNQVGKPYRKPTMTKDRSSQAQPRQHFPRLHKLSALGPTVVLVQRP